MAGAVSMKSGTQTMSCIGKSTFAQNTLTAPFLSRPQLFYMKWPTSTIDIQDVSNNGYYHNMKFKATAEAHSLIIEKHQKYDWTVTKLPPEAAA